METKFSLYLAILKNALMSLFLLLSNGDVSDAATDSKTVAPVVEKTAAPTVDKTTAPTVDKTTAPVVDKTTAPVVDKTTAPVVDKTTAPVVDNTTAPVVDKTTAPVVDKTVAATGANMVVDAIKKEAPVPTPGSPEALKAELLAELKVVLKEQVEKTVSAKMANPNAPVSVVSNASQTDAKPADTKAIAQNAAASVVAGGGHGTPCNMLTSATCGQNSTDCSIFKGYCLPKCDALSVDVCEKTPNCKLSGLVTKTCGAAS